MTKFTKYMQINPVEGIFFYSLLFIVGLQVFIPPGAFIAIVTPTFMTLFGSWEGILIHFLVIYVAQHIAIMLTFFIGRYFSSVGKSLAKKIEYFEVFNSLVTTKGIRITILMRLCLVIPYSVINYIMSMWEYLLLS